MRKALLALGAASLMAGTAMAAEPLTNQQMDKVAAGIPSPLWSAYFIQNEGCPDCDINVQKNFNFTQPLVQIQNSGPPAFPTDIPRPDLSVFNINIPNNGLPFPLTTP